MPDNLPERERDLLAKAEYYLHHPHLPLTDADLQTLHEIQDVFVRHGLSGMADRYVANACRGNSCNDC